MRRVGVGARQSRAGEHAAQLSEAHPGLVREAVREARVDERGVQRRAVAEDGRGGGERQRGAAAGSKRRAAFVRAVLYERTSGWSS
eukprot:11317-Pelagococcus_subviridis.AAC.1